MNGNLARMLATLFIWAGATVMITENNLAITEGNAVLLIGILAGIAGLCTLAVWVSGREHDVAQAAAEAEKNKRVGSRRVERLVDSLSEDELDQLRARLQERDDMVPLETLLNRPSRDRQ